MSDFWVFRSETENSSSNPEGLAALNEIILECIDTAETVGAIREDIRLVSRALLASISELGNNQTEIQEVITVPLEQIQRVAGHANRLMLLAETHGCIGGALHKLADALLSTREVLPDSQLSSGKPPKLEQIKVASIEYRQSPEDYWENIDILRFTALTETEKTHIIVGCERRFLDKENKEIDESSALMAVSRYFGIDQTTKTEIGHLKKNFNVLVVDDDDLMRSAVAKRLKRRFKKKVEVVPAHDGQECMAILEGTHESKTLAAPYIVFMDVRMPGKSGLEILETIRKDPNLKDTIVFLVTASDDEATRSRAEELGCDGYLLKNSL